jgi:hypothetical protein
MNLKKMIFGILILGLSTTTAMASAIPLNFKALPGECKSLGHAEYLHYIDDAIGERDKLAKEAATSINSAAQAGPRQQACQKYIQAVQKTQDKLKSKLQPARFPTGSANMIGGVAVFAGISKLAPDCYKGIRRKDDALNLKEADLRQLCTSRPTPKPTAPKGIQ